jgi:hypothetical protein
MERHLEEEPKPGFEQKTDGQSMRVAGKTGGRKTTKVPYRPWVIFVTLMTFVGHIKPAAAAFECNDETWQGMSGLYAIARSVAGANRTKLTATIDYEKLNPADALLIVHPQVHLDDSSLSAFIQAGGRVAVLDDFGDSEPFLERFSVHRLPAPTNPANRLRDNVHLPIATPVENSTGTDGVQRHPIVKNIDQVVLNHPTALDNPGLTAVLELRTKDSGAVPIAITGVVGTERPGRLFAMSDPSALMNLMLRYPGNRNFAQGLVNYLTEDDGRAGKGQLYIVTNRFEQSGQFGMGLGPMSDARRTIERLIRELRHGIPPAMLVLLVVATLLGIARWVYFHSFRTGAPTLPKFLRAVPIAAQAGWPGRAAVLMSPSTHPAYVVLELRASFREQLTRLLSADPGINSSALLSLVEERRILDPQPFEHLKGYLAELDGYERAVTARRGIRIRPPTLSRLMRQGLDILGYFNQVERKRREPSPSSE